MPDAELRVSIRAGDGKGADLQAVLARLGGLQKLYEAAATASVRPGAARPATTQIARANLGLRFVDASPTNSLSVALVESLQTEEAAEPESLHIEVAYNFRRSLIAASHRNTADIISLFQEKADQVRVLRAIEHLSPDDNEAPVVIENASTSNGKVVFLAEHRKWAQRSMPNLEPEVGTYRGMLKKGVLGAHSSFSLHDGVRAIAIRPNRAEAQRLRDLFGRVVEISGTATFASTGVVKQLSQLTMIEPYRYRPNILHVGNREFLLSAPFDYEVVTGEDSEGFLLTNEELNAACYGKTLKAAIAVASEDFVSLWDEIAQAEESEIHPSALGVRSYLLQNVREVTQLNGHTGELYR
jgi:hypothetical protein